MKGVIQTVEIGVEIPLQPLKIFNQAFRLCGIQIKKFIPVLLLKQSADSMTASTFLSE